MGQHRWGRGEARTRMDGQGQIAGWNASSAPDADPVRRIAHLEEQLATLTDRFEALQATATELVTAEDVDQVLYATVEHAGLAVRAPQYVLAVRLSTTDAVRVEHRGFEASPPAALVEELLADDPGSHDGSRLLVDVTTTRRRFGRLAALSAPGTRFLPMERQLLEAYAANAAVALQAAAALEEARRRHDTTRALLQLSTALARVGHPDDVAQRIAEAVPAVVGDERSTVLLWDDEQQELRFAGFCGLPESATEALRSITVRREDTPALGSLLVDKIAISITAGTGDPFLDALLEITDVTNAVVVPIVAADRFVGAVAADIGAGDRQVDDDLLERCAGLAAQAATALENGHLVAQLRERSLHDPLTGLPNRRLLRDRIEHALALARRTDHWPTLVFIDLDHFKAINDTYGHLTGDAVVTTIADRVRRTLRRSDTVARIGGDEFAVLVEAVSDCPDGRHRIADLLLAQMRQPVLTTDSVVQVTASIGVVTATAEDDHDSLLRRADTAMYAAKATGRDAAVFG
jgi:diguanylate cyclase (GGDEF)-like protein